MNGPPAGRYVSEEELVLGRGRGVGVGIASSASSSSASSPFEIIDDIDDDIIIDDDDDDYVNGDDAYAPVQRGRKGGKDKVVVEELWRDDIRSQNHHRNLNLKNDEVHAFEMVPLSIDDGDNQEERVDFNYDEYDNEDGGGGGDERHPPTSSSSGGGGGDDYATSNTVLPKYAYHYLYPPTVPREVQLLRMENVAVPACYLLVGLLQGLSGPFTNVYPLDLEASEAQQATISSLKSLPSTFKLVFGFVSDNLPLFGYRRKSYMLIGWAVTSLSMFLLLSFSDLSMDAVVEQSSRAHMFQESGGGGGMGDGNGERHLQSAAVGEPPSIPFLSSSLLLFGTGFWFADVMGDSIVAEKAKLEPEDSRGHLQSTCYACRFFGLMIAAPLSTVIYSSRGPGAVVALMAALPASIVPLVYMLKETKNAPVESTRHQCGEIWNTVCSRAVWQPMGFVYLYNVLQVGNAAWKQYLKTVLGFTSNQLNSLLIAAYVLLWLGIMAYKKFFIRWSWRTVYVSTTLLNGVFSALQILLIQGITFGLSPFLFALGDDAFADFIGGIQFLPTTIMMVHLCPAGSEGASYAMFTTMSNSAYTLATAFSTLLLGVWDVSKEAMERGELSGMVNLTALTTLIQVSGLLFVGLLPRTKDDLANLSQSGSRVGGFLFLFVTFASVLYSLVVGVLNIIKPGWAGES